MGRLMDRPSELKTGKDNPAPGTRCSHNCARRSKSSNRIPLPPESEETSQTPPPEGWRIRSPRKNPSTTFSARPPLAGTCQVSHDPPRSEPKTIDRPPGNHP